MAGSNWLERWARSARTWVALAVLAPVLMLAVSGAMLLEMRREAWEKARQTSENLLQLIERDIARNVEIIDLSLSRLVEGVGMPAVLAAEPSLRQLILFDRAATARDIGVMLALDENGDVTLDSAGYPPRKLNNADRSYFKAHRGNAGLGLTISEPLVSRLTGSPIVVLSRRIDKPDGSFGGVALASLKLSYFQRLFDRIGLGPEGAVNLYRTDGVRLMRYPFSESDIGASIAGSANFERFISAPGGSFVATSVRDGVERYYSFTKVGDLPLVLNVALGADDVEAQWRGRAIALGLVLLSLCALTAGLALLFGRELKRGADMQGELARLSRTDSLTGLPNRRCFEEEFARVFGEAQRFGRPLSLLVVDADHFKRINDRYGHGVGDEVLKGLARALGGSVHRPGDLVARVGGEEFVVVLPQTDAAGAARIAEKIHGEVARLGVESAGIGAGAITVSVGSVSLPASATVERDAFYRLADAALYEAKAGGRNQTRAAAIAAPAPQHPARVRLVGND